MFGFPIDHNPCNRFFPRLLPTQNNDLFESKLGTPLSPAPIHSKSLVYAQANTDMRETKNSLLLSTRAKPIPFIKKNDIDEELESQSVLEQRCRELDANLRVWNMYFLISNYRGDRPSISSQRFCHINNPVRTHTVSQNNRRDYIDVIAQHDDKSLLGRADSLEQSMPFDMSI